MQSVVSSLAALHRPKEKSKKKKCIARANDKMVAKVMAANA